MEERIRFFVRRHGDQWTFGREDRAFMSFRSKEAAVARGKEFVSKIGFATLVIEDTIPTIAKRLASRR